MSVVEGEELSVVQAAYRVAWTSFNTFHGLSSDERLTGPERLRDYIEILVCTGERDLQKIANSALGLLREYDQISRSYARVSSPPISEP